MKLVERGRACLDRYPKRQKPCHDAGVCFFRSEGFCNVGRAVRSVKPVADSKSTQCRKFVRFPSTVPVHWVKYLQWSTCDEVPAVCLTTGFVRENDQQATKLTHSHRKHDFSSSTDIPEIVSVP